VSLPGLFLVVPLSPFSPFFFHSEERRPAFFLFCAQSSFFPPSQESHPLRPFRRSDSSPPCLGSVLLLFFFLCGDVTGYPSPRVLGHTRIPTPRHPPFFPHQPKQQIVVPHPAAPNALFFFSPRERSNFSFSCPVRTWR